MTTETNLSAEEPSERASTGPQHYKVTDTYALETRGDAAAGEVERPSQSRIATAISICIVLTATMLLPTAVAAILYSVDLPAWLVAASAGAALVICLGTAVVVAVRKGWLNG